MIAPRVLRRIARERGLALDLVEKDYLIGWILFCVCKTSFSDSLAFKGGTALSKVYYPFDWRLSEDLDFTLLTDEKMSIISTKLAEEIPAVAEDLIPEAGLRFSQKPFANPGFVRGRLRYSGPISPNNVRIEITKEAYLGSVGRIGVPQSYEDYPQFKLTVYSLETILAEKMRTLLQRERVRDWYDVWRLSQRIQDLKLVGREFTLKLEGKGMSFPDVEDFFPQGLRDRLIPHWDMSLVRLTPEKLPSVDDLLSETQEFIERVLSEK